MGVTYKSRSCFPTNDFQNSELMVMFGALRITEGPTAPYAYRARTRATATKPSLDLHEVGQHRDAGIFG